MIGHIESYDEKQQTGAIKCEEELYEFHIDDWFLNILPKIGGAVDFLPEDDGRATQIGPVGDFLQDMTPVKNHYVAGILGIILGGLGIHRIYLGFYRIAIAQILISVLTLGYGVVWGFIDGFLILSGQINRDGKGRPLK
jgi:TM2 domain-containing membrane protein YozV